MAGRIRWRYVRLLVVAAGALGALLLTVDAASAAAPGGTTSPAVPPGTGVSAPTTVQWVQNHRATTVWADQQGDRALAPAPQWTHFQVAGPQELLRVPVFDPRTGARGWIDALALGPSGAPPEATTAPSIPPAAPTSPTTGPSVASTAPVGPTTGPSIPPTASSNPTTGSSIPPTASNPATGPFALPTAPANAAPSATARPTPINPRAGSAPLTIRPVAIPPAAPSRPANPPPAAPAEPVGERWLQNHSPTTLWADRDGDAPVASLPQWTFLRLTGRQDGRRVPVQDARSGATGWVEAQAVGPSGPPPAPPPADAASSPTTAEPARPSENAAALASRSVARPASVRPGERWIDVDLAQQQLRLIEGDVVVHTAPVTTGKAGFPTPKGTFRIFSRVANDTMDSQTTGIARESGEGYLMKDVRFAQYFASGGFALHTNYWQPDSVFGHATTSHGCVGMRLSDAETVWNFASHGTVVNIH